MSNIEKRTDRQLAPEHANTKESSELFEQFKQLKPIHASNEEALQTLICDLETLAAQQNLTVAALLHEAHSATDSKPYHIQATTLERMIGNLRR